MSDIDTKVGVSSVTSVMLGMFIGGAAVSVALGLLTFNALRSSPSLPVLVASSPPTISIITPDHGDVASYLIPIEVIASDDSGIDRVEFEIVSVNPYTGQIGYNMFDADSTAPYEIEYNVPEQGQGTSDHFFVMIAAKAFGNDGSSTRSQHKQVNIDRCDGDDACARVYQSVPLADRFGQTVTGLQAGSNHTLSFRVKQGTSEVVRVVVTSVDGNEEYGSCEYQINVEPPLFWHDSSCDFVPTSSTAKITLMAGSASDPHDEQYFAYFDNLALSHGQLSDPSFIINDGSWSGIGGMIASGSPLTTIKSFFPNDITAAVTNMETDTTDQVYISFVKSYPSARWEQFTVLGNYDFNNEYWGVDHFFGDGDIDEAGFASPMLISIGGVAENPSEFFYEDVVMHVESDIGELDICLPDLIFEDNDVTWDGRLGQFAFLLVDDYGNTYNTLRSPNPDFLRPEYLAKQCQCSDGTVSGQCNANNRLCKGQVLEQYKCGACGITCPATYTCSSGECCKKVNGEWDCDGLNQESPSRD